MTARAGVARDVLVVACAISAGIHAALAPRHFAGGVGPGLGFAAAAGLLACLVVGLTRLPASTAAVAGAAAVLAALLASYALATTSGLPLLHPETEPADGLALVTKAIEAAGLVAAVHLLAGGRAAAAPSSLHSKGRLT